MSTPAEGQYIFNLAEGKTYAYSIEIEMVQRAELTSANDRQSAAENLSVGGSVTMDYSLKVIENQDDDYARIVCRFDNLRAHLKSRVDGIETNLSVEALKDNVRIWIDDSLASVHSTDSQDTGGAGEFYERLLFIGEDITMLVYPDGEIMNIIENKNLWEMAQDLIGMPDEGFLEIIFPQNLGTGGKTGWEQSLAIKKLGDFKLKEPSEPLVTHYAVSERNGQSLISFNGALNLHRFSSETSVDDLDDEMKLSTDDFKISKNGKATFAPGPGVIDNFSYEMAMKGSLYLEGSGREEYTAALVLDFTSKVTYKLKDSP